MRSLAEDPNARARAREVGAYGDALAGLHAEAFAAALACRIEREARLVLAAFERDPLRTRTARNAVDRDARSGIAEQHDARARAGLRRRRRLRRRDARRGM